tara:strand:- start:3453 stop:3596 length:144 start_codon:yes stop_codon:yes gene_type:complete
MRGFSWSMFDIGHRKSENLKRSGKAIATYQKRNEARKKKDAKNDGKL